jgi:hypothetical protein
MAKFYEVFKHTFKDVVEVQTPTPDTDTHSIIPHHVAVNEFKKALVYRDYTINSEWYKLYAGGNTMLCILALTHPSLEYNGKELLVLIRNNHNKRHALSGCAGFRVFACENGLISGDLVQIHRKHTKGLTIESLPEMLDTFISVLETQWHNLNETTEEMLLTHITSVFNNGDIMQLTQWLHGFYAEGLLTMQQYVDFIKEVLTPSHTEFDVQNVYRLYMAVTNTFAKNMNSGINKFKRINEKFAELLKHS